MDHYSTPPYRNNKEVPYFDSTLASKPSIYQVHYPYNFHNKNNKNHQKNPKIPLFFPKILSLLTKKISNVYIKEESISLFYKSSISPFSRILYTPQDIISNQDLNFQNNSQQGIRIQGDRSLCTTLQHILYIIQVKFHTIHIQVNNLIFIY